MSNQVPAMLPGPQPPMNQRYSPRIYTFLIMKTINLTKIDEVEDLPSLFELSISLFCENNSSMFNYLNIIQASELLYSSTSAGTWLYDTERNHFSTWWLQSIWTFFSCSLVSNFSFLVFSVIKTISFSSKIIISLFTNDFGFRIQTFCNEGQVDQAAVIPNIDNMQQENFVPRYWLTSSCWFLLLKRDYQLYHFIFI